MTLIGNKQTLAFEISPVNPSWERRYVSERAAWAGLAIWVGEKNLCSHIFPGTSELRDAFFLPLVPLADWLLRSGPALRYEERASRFPTTAELHETADRWADARPPQGMTEDEWLDARDQWYSRHFMRAGADGARVPDLAFVRDDEHLVVAWRRPSFFGPNVPVMLWPDGHLRIPWHQGWETLREFTGFVDSWLRQEGVDDLLTGFTGDESSSLPEHDLLAAIEYLTGRDLRALAAVLGVEADATRVLDRLGLTSETDDPASSPSAQILRDVGPRPTPGLSTGLEVIAERIRHGDGAEPTWRQGRSVSLDAANAGGSPEGSGQLAASRLRDALGLDGRPVNDLAAQLGGMGMAYEHLDMAGAAERMLVGARDERGPASVTLDTVRTRTPWGQRFEAARALGHALLDPMRGGALGAAGGTYAQATRRRRSGAFAAEFLLPASAMSSVSDQRLDGATEGDRFPELLGLYGVGARTAAHQLWNGGWLSSPVLRDELIDQFAQPG